jgi:AcrR family transcriptional regulator
VSKGALYLYFKNKDELILESAKNMKSQLSQLHKMQMATSPTRRPLDVWTETLDNFVPFNPQINMLFFELVAVTERNPEINKISSKNLADEIEILEHEITTQQQDGLIRTDVDPRTIVVALISIFNGLRLMNILGMDQSEIRKRWIEMGRIILGAKD